MRALPGRGMGSKNRFWNWYVPGSIGVWCPTATPDLCLYVNDLNMYTILL